MKLKQLSNKLHTKKRSQSDLDNRKLNVCKLNSNRNKLMDNLEKYQFIVMIV